MTPAMQPRPFEVLIAGTTYRLQWTYNAIADLEQETGEKFDTLIAKAADGSIYAVRALLCAVLRTHQPATTIADAGTLMHAAGGPQALADVLTGAAAQQQRKPKRARRTKAKPRESS